MHGIDQESKNRCLNVCPVLLRFHCVPFSSGRNIGKGESLIGDSCEDWPEAECSEAKRLKVLNRNGSNVCPFWFRSHNI